jgi:hypothetical protein
MNRAELAAMIQEQLRTRGIDVVLCGGACVSIYSEEKYVSADLDLIHTALLAPKRNLLQEAMHEIGFSMQGRYFRHEETDLYIEFPKGPPAIGDEPVKAFHNLQVATGVLRLLSPTDCVRDRLAGYFYFNDHQCLEQAILVAANNDIDLSEVERWSIREGKENLFFQFRELLERKCQT